MTSKFIPAIFLMLAGFSTSTFAITGNEYRQLPNSQRIAWIYGVTDGFSTAELIATKKQPEIVVCFSELEWEQIKAIFEKSLNSDPERWHFPAAFIFREAFYKYCRINE